MFRLALPSGAAETGRGAISPRCVITTKLSRCPPGQPGICTDCRLVSQTVGPRHVRHRAGGAPVCVHAAAVQFRCWSGLRASDAAHHGHGQLLFLQPARDRAFGFAFRRCLLAERCCKRFSPNAQFQFALSGSVSSGWPLWLTVPVALVVALLSVDVIGRLVAS